MAQKSNSNQWGTEEGAPSGVAAGYTVAHGTIVASAAQETRRQKFELMKIQSQQKAEQMAAILNTQMQHVVVTHNDLNIAAATRTSNDADALITYTTEMDRVASSNEVMTAQEMTRTILKMAAENKLLKTQVDNSKAVQNTMIDANQASANLVLTTAFIGGTSLLQKKGGVQRVIQNVLNQFDEAPANQETASSGARPRLVFKPINVQEERLAIQDTQSQSHSARQASDSIRRFTTAPDPSATEVGDDGNAIPEEQKSPIRQLRYFQTLTRAGQKLNLNQMRVANEMIDQITKAKGPEKKPVLVCPTCDKALNYKDIQLQMGSVLDTADRKQTPNAKITFTFPTHHPNCFTARQAEEASSKVAGSFARLASRGIGSD